MRKIFTGANIAQKAAQPRKATIFFHYSPLLAESIVLLISKKLGKHATPLFFAIQTHNCQWRYFSSRLKTNDTFLHTKPGIMMCDDKYSLCDTKGVKRREGAHFCSSAHAVALVERERALEKLKIQLLMRRSQRVIQKKPLERSIKLYMRIYINNIYVRFPRY